MFTEHTYATIFVRKVCLLNIAIQAVRRIDDFIPSPSPSPETLRGEERVM
jgi:hypothetical protein